MQDGACYKDNKWTSSTDKAFRKRPADLFKTIVASRAQATTMSVAERKKLFPTSAAPPQLMKGGTVSNPSRCNHTLVLTPPPSGSLRLGKAQVCLALGTCGVAVWSFLIVLGIYNAMPDTQGAELAKLDHSGKALPLDALLRIGMPLLIILLLVYAVIRPQQKTCDEKTDTKIAGKRKTCDEKTGTKLAGKKGPAKVAGTLVLAIDLEMGHVEQSWRDSEPSPHRHADTGDDGFVSCDEDDEHDSAEVALPGACSIYGYLIEKHKLPEGAGYQNYQALAESIHKLCSFVEDISQDQALRLSLGLNFDTCVAVEKWREVCAWRNKYEMNKEHARCIQMQLPSAVETISFPHQDEIYSKAFVASPCALVSRIGEPISLWHVGTGSSSASSVPLEHIEQWGRSVFEYADVWAKTQSLSRGRLLGHIQVFDMAGVGFRQMTNTALQARFKHALGCGANYVELVSHIYVINSSWAFTSAWKIIKPLLSPRTASKVTVAIDVPQALIDILAADSVRLLPEILRASGQAHAKVQRPPGRSLGP